MRLRNSIAVTALALALSVPVAAQQQPTGEKPAVISAIPGVVAKGAKWQRVWMGPMTADGMSAASDGSLLFAQEQSNSIMKLWPDGKVWPAYPYVEGAGSVAVDGQGRVFAVSRGCTDPGLHLANCADPTPVMQLAPERKAIADKFSSGKQLGRLNDAIADQRGGVWTTQGGLYHVAADGTVSTVAEGKDLFTNGLALSPDGKTLYVTNRKTIVAFDVAADGSTSNRRDFVTLAHEPAQGFGGDGMAVDSEGRLYVTGDAGIYVFGADGKEQGVIPVARRAITLAFAGPDKKTLYVGAMGASDPDGKEWHTPDGVRNVAMTIYKVATLSSGPKNRPK